MEQGSLQDGKVGVGEAQSWSIPAEGFKGHVATDGSLLGTAGKWGACGLLVVQLDYDEELGPLHGMSGSTEAELQVQRTIKRAELKCMSTTKASLTGYGEEKENGSIGKQEILICGLRSGKNCTILQ